MSAVVHMDQTGYQRWDYFLKFYTLKLPLKSVLRREYISHIPIFNICFQNLWKSSLDSYFHLRKPLLCESKMSFFWKMTNQDFKCCLDVPQIVELGSLRTWKTECKKDLVIFVWLRRDCKLILWTHLILSLEIQKRPIRGRVSSID